jgi:transposase-like protein
VDLDGIDADSKLIVSWLVGGRDAEYAKEFMQDVADRLANRVQLTTDGHAAYWDAVSNAVNTRWRLFGIAIKFRLRRRQFLGGQLTAHAAS